MPLEVLILRLWQWRGRVVLLALLLFGAGAFTVFSLPRSFVAEAVVAPSETTGIATSSLLSASPAFSGLLDPRPAGNFAIYLGALRSAEAAMQLVEATPLLAVRVDCAAAAVGITKDASGDTDASERAVTGLESLRDLLLRAQVVWVIALALTILVV